MSVPGVALGKYAQAVGTHTQAVSQARDCRVVGRAEPGAGACIRGSRFVRIVLGVDDLGLGEGIGIAPGWVKDRVSLRLSPLRARVGPLLVIVPGLGPRLEGQGYRS